MRYLLLLALMVSLVGIVMVPDAYSATNPYDDIEISLVDLSIENIDEVQNAIIIKTLVTNNGKTVFEQYLWNVYVVDDLGRAYPPSEETKGFFAQKCGLWQLSFDVAPGIPEQQTICYEIPKDSKNLRLLFQDWQQEDGDDWCGKQWTNCHSYPPIYLSVPTPVPTPPTPVPTPPTPELSTGCGEGTVLVDGVCQLEFLDIDPLQDAVLEWTAIGVIMFVVLGIPIIIIIVVVILIRRRKKTPKLPSADYGDVKKMPRKIKDYSIKPKKEDKKEEASTFCDNCGAAFKKSTAKFCGGCGTPRS